VLSGGGASTAPLASGVGKFLGCEVGYANPFTKLGVPGKYKELTEQFPHVFSVAVGLALRSVGDKPA
jgi:Tfp pilus assembly PilM family ATPase